MEITRKTHKRIIFHIDVNSAFLSWSAVKQLKDKPGSVDLRTIPSAVAGDVETRHGVITARSIPAKKYGVQTGEPVVKALTKCPDLVLVKGDFQTYRAYSHAFIKILRTYSTTLEQASIDEAYLDMTGTESLYQPEDEDDDPFPYCAANRLKNEIRNTLGFTVNVGISTNKLLAKMASDFEKPDRIHTLYPEEVPDKLWNLPIERLYGCGEMSAEKLRSLGVRTIGDAAAMEEEVLCGHLGEKAGAYIWRSANGLSDAPVATRKEDAKGYSNEVTLPKDVTIDNYDEVAPEVLHSLSDKIASRLKTDNVYAQTIAVIIKTDRFVRHSRQMKLPDMTDSPDKIYEIASLLLRRLLFGEQGIFGARQRIRLIGIQATNLDKGAYRQLNIFDLMQ